MKIKDALKLAEFLASRIAPFCEPDSVRIVGSIRREKPEVKDIELIALPLWKGSDLFGDLERGKGENQLHRWALETRAIRWVKAGRGTLAEGNLENAVPDHKGRYWRGLINAPGWEPVMLDLFLPTPEGYGAQELIRTGSAEFSEAVVTHARRVGYCFDGGCLWRQANSNNPPAIVHAPREADIFAALGLQCIPPSERRDRDSLKGSARVD